MSSTTKWRNLEERPRTIIILAVAIVVLGAFGVINLTTSAFHLAHVEFSSLILPMILITVISTGVISYGLLQGKEWALPITLVFLIILVIITFITIIIDPWWLTIVVSVPLIVAYGVLIFFIRSPKTRGYFGKA